MKPNTFGVVLFVIGVVLMYSAVKNQDPRDVVGKALGQKSNKFGPINPDAGPGKAGKFAEGGGKGTLSPAPSEGFGTAPRVTPPGTVWVSV